MSSRLRQSTATATPARETPGRGTPATGRRGAPAASQLVANELPPYEPLAYSLDAVARQQLAALAQPTRFSEIHELLTEVTSCLSVVAAEVIDAVINKEAALKKQRQRHEQAEEDGHDDASAARIEQMEQELEEMRAKADNVASQLEQDVRKAVDFDAHFIDLQAILKDLNSQVTTASTQQTQRTQRTQRADDDDDEYPDFDPTDPTNATQNQRPVSVAASFNDRLARATDRYQAKSLVDRYSHHNSYRGYKKSVHDAQYGDEKALPPEHLWFTTSTAQPGETQLGAEDSDDDIQIAKETISTKCPLTLQEFRDPVTSRKCPHSFEREAITSMIEDPNNVQRIAGLKAVECPMGGCKNMLTVGELHSDPVLKRKIARIQKANREAEESDDDDDDEPRGKNRPQSIGSDEDDAMDIDDTPAVGMKAERFSGMPVQSQRVRGEATVLEIDDDDDV